MQYYCHGTGRSWRVEVCPSRTQRGRGPLPTSLLQTRGRYWILGVVNSSYLGETHSNPWQEIQIDLLCVCKCVCVCWWKCGSEDCDWLYSYATGISLKLNIAMKWNQFHCQHGNVTCTTSIGIRLVIPLTYMLTLLFSPNTKYPQVKVTMKLWTGCLFPTTFHKR